MLILDKLWEGAVDPAGRYMERRPEYLNCLREQKRARESLMGELSSVQQERFEDVEQRMRDMAAYLERDAFFAGFRLCGMLLLDILEDTP